MAHDAGRNGSCPQSLCPRVNILATLVVTKFTACSRNPLACIHPEYDFPAFAKGCGTRWHWPCLTFAAAQAFDTTERVGGSARANLGTGELTIPCLQVQPLRNETEGMFYEIVLKRRGKSWNYGLPLPSRCSG